MFEEHRASHYTAETMRRISECGLNAVRLPLGYWILQEPGQPDFLGDDTTSKRISLQFFPPKTSHLSWSRLVPTAPFNLAGRQVMERPLKVLAGKLWIPLWSSLKRLACSSCWYAFFGWNCDGQLHTTK